MGTVKIKIRHINYRSPFPRYTDVRYYFSQSSIAAIGASFRITRFSLSNR